VDGEVKRILDEAFQRAKDILSGDMDTLQKMAEALLERETLDREEVDLLAQGKDLPTYVPPAPEPPEPDQEGPTEDLGDEPGTGPILGAPPAEPAGA